METANAIVLGQDPLYREKVVSFCAPIFGCVATTGQANLLITENYQLSRQILRLINLVDQTDQTGGAYEGPPHAFRRLNKLGPFRYATYDLIPMLTLMRWSIS